MVLQILAHSGQIDHRVDPEFSQSARATNAGQLEYLWGVQSSAREYSFFANANNLL